MKRTLKIILSIAGVLVGMGSVMPAVAQWRQEGGMTTSSVALLLLGAVLTLGGVGAAVHGVARQRA
ncbi:MAG: hypothetical protein EXS35_01245 [Pedosphaera sp.]|nr:hypothetical protein [Pedosphaera sp.]